MIERRNILELIGKHRGKYHSCILSCYSLDFSFFEERVLPVLRTANIKNVNILADGHFLELAQEITTGKEFKHNKTYNFQPVYAKGVFHPKIMLLTGVKHGLLIIGSGNITSSGLSTNDEIWGAFHLDNISNENAQIFSQVWKYLQRFTSESHGFITQKMEWITKYSPWLNELPDSEGEIFLESINQSFQFVSNSKEKSSFEYIMESIPKKGIQEITIISPYFDKKGVVLEELYNHFKPEKFNCIVDLNSGLLPHDLTKDVADRISFYNWSECKNDYVETFNRLHAKIFHFQYENNQEFILIGSANATKEALGTSGYGSVNDEAGILMQRKSSTNWLKELKIQLPSSPIIFDNLPFSNGLGNSSIPRQKYDHRILYSELRGHELTVYINNDPTDNLELNILSREDIKVESLKCRIDNKHLLVHCENPENVFKIFLSEGKNRISNYSIVHRFESLIRCNPDPNQEKLDALLEEDYPDGEGVTILLQYVDYNWADEEDGSLTTINGSIANRNNRSDKEITTREYDKLNASEFNTVSNEILLKQSGELSNSNLKIAEFLNLLNIGNSNKRDDFDESEEQRLLEDTEQKGEGSDIPTSITKKSIAYKEKKAIADYFKKLDQSYSNLLLDFYEAKALSVTPSEKITIRSLSNMLIALQLIQIYQGKKYTILGEENEAEVLKEESYILDGNIYSGQESIKSFFVNVYGKFLLLSCAGMKEYDYDILNQKLAFNRFQVTLKSIFTILNLNWKDNEKPYMETLLLNTLFFINPKELNLELRNDLIEKLKSHKLHSKYVCNEFDENFKLFTDIFLNDFFNWNLKFKDLGQRKFIQTIELEKGSIIFNSKIGFTVVNKLHKSDPPKLDLLREGFPKVENDFLVGGITFGSKCVKYEV